MKRRRYIDWSRRLAKLVSQSVGHSDWADFAEWKTGRGHHLSVMFTRTHFQVTWIDRGGIKEGWERHRYKLGRYGYDWFRKSLKNWM